MKFSEEVLQNCNKEFLSEMSSLIPAVVSKYDKVYYTDLRDYGYGIVPSMLVMLMEVEDKTLYNVIEPTLRKYSDIGDEDCVMSSLTILPKPVTELKVFCVDE